MKAAVRPTILAVSAGLSRFEKLTDASKLITAFFGLKGMALLQAPLIPTSVPV